MKYFPEAEHKDLEREIAGVEMIGTDRRENKLVTL